MAFHPSRSLRLAFAALVLAALLAASAAALLVFPGDASAATCKGKTQAWKVNGKTVCLKTARPAGGHAAAELTGRFANWLSAIDDPRVAKRVKAPAKFNKARPKLLQLVDRAFDKTATLGEKKPRRRGARAAARGAVVDSISVDSGTVKASNGVELSATVDARAFEDGSQDFKLTISAKIGNAELRFEPLITGLASTVPHVECPTADGKLTIDHTSVDGGTIKGYKKGRLVGAVTAKSTDTLHSEGQVGRDALLHDVRSTVTSKDEQYARGMQLVDSTSATFTIPREGIPVMQGTPSANVRVKVAGATRAQEREAEVERAAELAASRGTQNSLASWAELGRWRMKADEYKWYTIPNSCATVQFSPDSVATLAAGQTMTVKGKTLARAGGESPGEFTVQAVARGSFAAVKTQSDPGSPALFTAKGASPDADKGTVDTDLIATSMAGRAQAGWYARDDLDLPKKISGLVVSWSEIPGNLYNYFHSWVVFTLKDVYVSNDGYISAFYDLTTAEQDEVTNILGPSSGCRYEAKGSGGTINSGDLELRKPPGGAWTHAIQYDVSVPDGLFKATDCGPSPPPSFTGDITGFLNMAMIGGGFYPVEDGFHFEQVAISHTDTATNRTTTADWILDPGDPQ